MVVDDSAFMRRFLSGILVAEGHSVCVEALNAKEAVEKYKEFRPDLVTMDVVMPMMDELDGIGAVKEILKIDPDAKILLISVMKMESLLAKALEAGAKGFVTKPLQPDKVIEVVNNILNPNE